LKKSCQPWEKSKAFDGSCPISGFIPVAEFGDVLLSSISLMINGEIRQQGNTRDMITPVIPLISYISRFFTLRAGDIVLTGTPQGVGPIQSGDMLQISLNGHTLKTRII
jgi:2-keto-4-pentenoate hydratase/2-oxohepta-3-ene-1,7-dioic acid hydratase in catechol pathway